jgi:hypothetical protein
MRRHSALGGSIRFRPAAYKRRNTYARYVASRSGKPEDALACAAARLGTEGKTRGHANKQATHDAAKQRHSDVSEGLPL